MATTATMTGAQFDALPYEEGRKWELLDGELIPVPSPTLEHQVIINSISFALTLHFRSNPQRGIPASDVEFALDEDYRVRPDVLVLLDARATTVDMQRVPIPGAPDIAVEVISPSERSVDSQAKVQAYLRYGAQEVWQVFPRSRTVVVHRGATSTTLSESDAITSPLLPGFSLAVTGVFTAQASGSVQG